MTNYSSVLVPDRRLALMRRLSVAVLLGTCFVVIPVLNLMGVVPNHEVNRLGRYLCFAMVALGIDLIWGYTGILSLCQAFLFCLGGYAMAMHLSLAQGGGDVRLEYNSIPQFFYFNNVSQLPEFWKPFASMTFTLVVAIGLPTVLAYLFGKFIFQGRVRGVYFSIMTQAVAWAAYLAFCRNEMLLGGTNGLTNFYRPLNTKASWILGLYLVSLASLTMLFLLYRWLTQSRLGRVLTAIRDNETRLRFAGYRPDVFKVFAFALAAATASIGGILYVPQNGIITPNIMRVEDSVFFVIWVAFGGRGNLWGAVIGSLLVNYFSSTLTSDAPRLWPFMLGTLFLVAVLLPDGVSGLWKDMEARILAHRSIVGPAIALGGLVLFMVPQALGIVPDLFERQVVAVPVKYWLLVASLCAYTILSRRRTIHQTHGAMFTDLSGAVQREK